MSPTAPGALHADAVAVLGGWSAPDPAQERLRARFADHLADHGDATWRRCRPDHLTASTLVLDAEHRHALLTLHAKAGRWFQLGGHCEPGDPTLVSAALREAREESGIAGLRIDPVPVHLDEHAVAFCGPDDGTLVHHLDVRFLAVAPAGAEPARSEESRAVRWWPLDRLPPDAHEDGGVAALVRQGLARLRSQPEWSSGGGSSRAAADQPSR